jgi:hypothetical protein
MSGFRPLFNPVETVLLYPGARGRPRARCMLTTPQSRTEREGDRS